MSKRVLVPFDDSEQAHEALEYALTEHSGDELTVIHAIDPAEWGYGAPGNTLGERWQQQAREKSEEVQSSAQTVAEEYGVAVTTAAESGVPSDVVIQYADDNDVDHIVIGSHGRSGTKRLLLGSVAEEVARKVSIPVTIIG
ncbi:universal stress protein [Halococcus sp. AFM35]|uniref:universal stress protein n=1 Tax=Halococcus sp. AFM35 TaxID=3421653 RepID=UPI003EBED12D